MRCDELANHDEGLVEITNGSILLCSPDSTYADPLVRTNARRRSNSSFVTILAHRFNRSGYGKNEEAARVKGGFYNEDIP